MKTEGMKLIKAIDIHAHVVLGKTSKGAAERCLAEAVLFGVEKVCSMGNVTCFGENPEEKEVRAINDENIELVRRHPGFCLGFCFLNPANDPAFIREETDRCIRQEGFKGIKLWIAVKASDKKLDTVMEGAAKFGVPVLQHAWYKAMGNRGQESSPSDVAVLASRFPGIKIIMGHMAGCGVRGIIDIEKFPDVYVETGCSPPVGGLVEFAAARLGPERILFGSDVPGRCFPSQLGRIYGANISNKAKKRILWDNGAGLLGIR